MVLPGRIHATELMYLCLFSTCSSVHPLDSIAGLLDLSLVYHLWISASFLLFTWHITLVLFRIFVTEVYISRKQNVYFYLYCKTKALVVL